jgi:hypothetical protein
MMNGAMRIRAAVTSVIVLCLLRTASLCAEMGKIRLDVLDELGAGAKPAAEILAGNGAKVAEVAPGASVALPPGTYKMVLPVIGGKIVRENLRVEAGRVHTVLITNVAVLSVSARKTNGEEPGFGVTVTGVSPPHAKLAEFLSGEKMLFAPQQVDVKVDVPPQGYLWHAVALQAGHRASLQFKETQPAQLIVRTTLLKAPIDASTRVVIYEAGTQKQAGASPPGAEHSFSLDPGDYDIYVENNSGKGRPTAMDRSVHLESGQQVERQEALDGETTANGK